MKRVLQLIIFVVVAGLAYWLYEIIMTPIRFQEVQKSRETAIVQQLKDIRTAQRAYKSVYGRYTSDIDSLITFINTDSLKIMITMGSEDDSVAVAKGLVKTIEGKIAVKDTLFKSPSFKAEALKYIPHTNNMEIYMGAGQLTTESKVVIPVFEARAPYKAFLGDMDQQMLINLIDLKKTLNQYPGLKVGSLTESTNDAGNWE